MNRDLAAVKAMLLDALKATGEFSHLTINGSRCEGAHGCHDCKVDFDADKLAATVAEWFAAQPIYFVSLKTFFTPDGFYPTREAAEARLQEVCDSDPDLYDIDVLPFGPFPPEDRP